MRLRAATPADLALLRGWDEQPHVRMSDPNDDWAWETELARAPDWREQLIAEVDGRPVGFVQIIDPAREDSHYWGDCSADLRAVDIWIGDPSDLGRGFGTQIMKLALERCFADPSVRSVLVDPLESNARARRFYERLGFCFVEHRRFEQDACAVYRLDRARWHAAAAFEIRDARDADADALTGLCLRSKASWGYSAELMEQSTSALTVTPATLAAWRVRVAESAQGELLGVAAFSTGDVRKPDEAELELLFVEPDAMRRGIGRALLNDMRLCLSRLGVSVLWILSDPGAEPFYAGLGAVRAGLRPSDSIEGRKLPWLRLAIDRTISSLRTDRMILRPWGDHDLDPFAELNADERVARYLPSTLSRDESDAFAARIRLGFERHGFGLWAAERIDAPEHPFIGFIGLSVPGFDAHFTPCVEIGWRLAPDHWGVGLATEGAKAVAEYALSGLKLDEIVSFTTTDNRASWRVMEKIGMHRDLGADFDHPALPPGHPLRSQVLYRLARRRTSSDSSTSPVANDRPHEQTSGGRAKGTVRIRQLTPRDAELVSRLAESIQRIHFENDPATYKAPSATAASTWYEELLASPDTVAFVAEDDDRGALGHVITVAKSTPENRHFTHPAEFVEVLEVGVLEPFRGAGVGRALHDRVVDYWTKAGARELRLTVIGFNAGAHRYYERLGFVESSRRMSLQLRSGD